MRKTIEPGHQAMYGLYRIAVPMEEETLKTIDRLADQEGITRTEAAKRLMAWAAKHAAPQQP